MSKHSTAIALIGVLVIAGAVTYQTTWNSKSWLIDAIMEKGGAKDSDALNTKSKSELRGMLRSAM